MQKGIKTVSQFEFESTFSQLKNRYTDQYGLCNGKTGLCIAAFIYYRITKEEHWKKEAMQLLDEVCDNIGQVPQLDFSNGLPGIGWSIEWIVQNGFVEANTDEILEDLDDELYKTVIFSKAENLSLETGTIGRALFFYKRLMAQNPQTFRYRKICNIECLVLLIDQIHEILLDKETGLLGDAKPQDIKTIAQCLVFTTKLLPLRINYEKAKAINKELIKFVYTLSKNPGSSINPAYKPLWRAYETASDQLKNKQYKTHANKLLNALNTNVKHLVNLNKADEIYELLDNTTKKEENKELSNWKEAWLYI